MKSKIWRLVNYTFSQRNLTCSVFTKGWSFLTLSTWKLPKNCMITSSLHIHYKTQVRILSTECRVWYIDYLEINGRWCNTPNNTTNTLLQYCTCTCVTMRIIEKCDRPKLYRITGQNGLYFLLRLGRMSHAIGFQSETLNLPIMNPTYVNLRCLFSLENGVLQSVHYSPHLWSEFHLLLPIY